MGSGDFPTLFSLACLLCSQSICWLPFCSLKVLYLFLSGFEWLLFPLAAPPSFHGVLVMLLLVPDLNLFCSALSYNAGGQRSASHICLLPTPLSLSLLQGDTSREWTSEGEKRWPLLSTYCPCQHCHCCHCTCCSTLTALSLLELPESGSESPGLSFTFLVLFFFRFRWPWPLLFPSVRGGSSPYSEFS